MENLNESAEKSYLRATAERRKHLRNACLIEAYCMVQGCGYKGTIQNISEGGAYLQSTKDAKLLPGEEIFLVPRSRVLSDQLRCKIVWVGSDGMGVEFQISELDCGESEDDQEGSWTSGMEYKGMGRIKQRKSHSDRNAERQMGEPGARAVRYGIAKREVHGMIS